MKAVKLNCWQHKRCSRQPGGALAEQLAPCPAATDSICDGIAGRYDGRIDLESEVGMGTTFTIELPRWTPPEGEES